MGKRTELPSTRRHVHIFDEDWEYLLRKYGTTVGPSQAVRKIVHSWITRLRARETAMMEDQE